MRVRRLLAPDNPVRAWGRRIVHGTRLRPDVQLIRLERRLEILERLVDLDGKAPWVAEYVSLLNPQRVEGMRLERVGSVNDGGYVLPLDIFLRSGQGVISIGVGDNNEADVALAQRGLPVHAWDHTVSGLPIEHPLITFHRQGVGTAERGLLTLDGIVESSFHDPDRSLMLLIDAEGAEWSALDAVSERAMERISVIGAELHDMGNMLVDAEPYLRVLRKLATSFVPVAVHANNYMPVWDLAGVRVPDALEVTYVNRALVPDARLSDGNCAQALLSPCCPDLPDVELPWALPTSGLPTVAG